MNPSGKKDGGIAGAGLGLLIVMGATLFLSACAANRSENQLRFLKSLQFRAPNCEIISRRDGKVTCECNNIEWIRDVKPGRWIAACLKDPPGTQVKPAKTPSTTWIDEPSPFSSVDDDENEDAR